MRRLLATVILFSATAAPGQVLGPTARSTSSPARVNVREQAFEGSWFGEIVLPGNHLRVELEIFLFNGKTGQLVKKESGPLDALRATAVGPQLRLEFPEPIASFEGQIHPEGAQIIGKWKQGDEECWLVFRRLANEPNV